MLETLDMYLLYFLLGVYGYAMELVIHYVIRIFCLFCMFPF